jgi:hypothetical protein
MCDGCLTEVALSLECRVGKPTRHKCDVRYYWALNAWPLIPVLSGPIR